MSSVDDIAFFPFAEKLGYDSIWVTDSQMLFSDCYVVLALAAQATSRIKLGTGTAVCGTRIAPVQACSIATVNRLAPGRVFLGVGTGNTAMRTMAQKPMTIDDYRAYLRVLSTLLRGDVVDYTFAGETRPIKILMHDAEYMNLSPKIPLYVSGFGPRAMSLAGEFGDGLVFAIPPRGTSVQDAMSHVRAGAESVNRDPSGFANCALVNIVMPEPGEELNSARIIDEVGPNVIATVYYFYDYVHEHGTEPPDFLKPIWKRYCDMIEEIPQGHRHFRTHEYHYTRLHRGEAELITPELIRATCLVGGPDELVEHLRQLANDGLQQIMWATGTGGKWPFAEAFSRKVMSRM